MIQVDKVRVISYFCIVEAKLTATPLSFFKTVLAQVDIVEADLLCVLIQFDYVELEVSDVNILHKVIHLIINFHARQLHFLDVDIFALRRCRRCCQG